MFSLFKAERIKIFKSKKMWLTLGALLLLSIYQVIDAKLAVNAGAVLRQKIDIVVNGASGLLMIKKNGFAIELILMAFTAFYIGEEYQAGTIRNVLSLGRSRTACYLVKLGVVELVSLLGMLLVSATGMLGYGLCFGFGEIAGIAAYGTYALKTLSVLLLLVLSVSAVTVLLAMWLGNVGTTLIASFLFIMGSGFGPSLLQRFKNLEFLKKWFSNTFLFYGDFSSPQFLHQLFPEMLLCSLATIMVSLGIGVVVFQHQDVR